MVILDILNLEKENTQITLHKEGLFIRVYERSAFMFANQIKNYTITKKFYKNVKQEVAYLGFPQNSLSKIENLCKEQNLSLNQKNNQIQIAGFTSFLENEFVNWKNNIPLTESYNIVQSSRSHSLKESAILKKKIHNFSVISKTPIECQQFIVALQQEMNDPGASHEVSINGTNLVS